MTPKTLATFGLAAAVCLMPLAAQAHHGQQHPVKTKKVKQTKAPKKNTSMIRFVPSPRA